MGAAAGTLPAITVVVLCYNHEQYVEECLDSVAAQTFQDFELIVVDDASQDGSRDRIQTWLATHRPDATFLPQPRNRGICAVLNTALAASHGRVFALVAADDSWHPHKLEIQYAALSREPEDVAVVYSDAALMDMNGDELPGTLIKQYLGAVRPPSGQVSDELTHRNFIPAMGTLVRTESLRTVGGYDERLAYEDYDMWLRLGSRFRIVFVDAVVARYRIVAGSLGDELFSAKRRAVKVTHCQIALTQVESQWTSARNRAIWLERLTIWAHQLYLEENAKAPHFLRRVAMQTRRPRWIILAALTTLGMSKRKVHAVKRMLQFKGRVDLA